MIKYNVFIEGEGIKHNMIPLTHDQAYHLAVHAARYTKRSVSVRS